MTGLLADQMKNLLGELKQYVKTDEFKKTGAADQQVVYDAIERIQSMLPGGNGTLILPGCKRRCTLWGMP